jgi:hypothetical protein
LGQSTFTNHYAVAAKACYIEINASSVDHDDSFSRYSQIFDAFEGREYGTFLFKKTRANGQDVITCRIRPPGQSQIEWCKSEDEFDTLALKYFGTTGD